MDVSEVRDDLLAEQGLLDDIVADIDDEKWDLATPSPGWTIADQIGHLAYFDHAAATAITDPDGFMRMVNDFLAAAGLGLDAADTWTLGPFRALEPAQLLEAWRINRAQLAGAAATLTNDTRVSWYGPSMGSRSFLTARLMELWAHGQDIVDALGVIRPITDRIRHIAQLGFITRNWSYTNRGLAAPVEPVRVELIAPSGTVWKFGVDDAAESVTGPAVDFCRVVTQRRHLDDTALVASPLAREWLLIAQAYAGPPTDGPPPGERI